MFVLIVPSFANVVVDESIEAIVGKDEDIGARVGAEDAEPDK